MSPNENQFLFYQFSCMLFAVCSQNSSGKVQRKPGVHVAYTGIILSSVEFASSTYVETVIGGRGRRIVCARWYVGAVQITCRVGARKISGSCENFRDSSRCLQAIVDLPCSFSRVRRGFLYASITRGTGAAFTRAKKRANLRKTCSPRKRESIYVFTFGCSLTLCYRQTDFLST